VITGSGLQLGIALPQGSRQGSIDITLLREYALQAEAAGFDDLWTIEQITGRYSVLESVSLLAYLSAIAFCLGSLTRAVGHYLAVALLAVALLAAWAGLDGVLTVDGWGTQLLAFVLMQGFVVARLALRVALAGGQMALYRGDSR